MLFFEATLIPMYLIIGIWAAAEQDLRAFKFFLYTLLGSLLMLVALIYLYIKSGGSFDLRPGTSCRWAHAQTLLFFAFLAAFAVRCRCGRCTPGCPTCTSRRPPAARWCWRPSC